MGRSGATEESSERGFIVTRFRAGASWYRTSGRYSFGVGDGTNTPRLSFGKPSRTNRKVALWAGIQSLFAVDKEGKSEVKREYLTVAVSIAIGCDVFGNRHLRSARGGLPEVQHLMQI